MQDVEILFAKNNRLAIITLQRLKSLNALSLDMIKAMYAQLKIWEKDSSVDAVLIKSAHEKVFCAGGDIRSLYTNKNQDLSKKMDFFWHEYRLNQLIYSYKKPYISLLDGLTMGGGVGISLHGWYSVATQNFSFAMPETNIGFFPDIGATYFLSKAEPLGLYLALTGNRLDAMQSKAQNWVKYTINSNSIAELEAQLSQATCLTPDSVDKIINQYVVELPTKSINPLLLESFAKDSLGEVLKSLESISNNNEDINNVYKALKEKSSLSLMITFKQMCDAQHKNLEECLKIDYNLVAHFMSAHDFYEGVRALLIDKDKNPQWEFKNINDIDANLVNKYFTALDVKPLEF